jgi:hypothetical protein
LREEVEHVKPDAMDFLTGEDMTLALKGLIEDIRRSMA